MVLDDKINEIEEELNIDEIEFNLINNIVSKPEEFSEPYRRNIHLGDLSVPVGHTTNFFFGFIVRKAVTFEEIALTLIS